MCRLIFRKDTFIGSVTAEQEGFEKVYPLTENLLGNFPANLWMRPPIPWFWAGKTRDF